MSAGRRAYDLLRGYVNSEWDRIHGLDDDQSAHRELSDSLTQAVAKQTVTEPTPEPAPIDPLAHAQKILGVAPEAGFAEVRRAYERINKRADPANFPPDSAESIQAAAIQRRVQWAYSVLTENMDGTEKRFRSLEID